MRGCRFELIPHDGVSCAAEIVCSVVSRLPPIYSAFCRMELRP